MKKIEQEQKSNSTGMNPSQLSQKGFISALGHFKHLVRLFLTIVKSGFYFFRLGKRPVKSGLKLSPDALNTPLADGWLSTIRDFLTRTGKWDGHSVHSVEHFTCTPAIGIIAEPKAIAVSTQPVFASVGFGDITIADHKIACGRNVCAVLDFQGGGGQICSTLFCGVHQSHPDFDPSGDFWCLSHSVGYCPEIRDPCITYCGGGFCPPHHVDPCVLYCGGEGPDDYLPISDDIQAHWNHPFVQDLRAYFGVSSVETLGQVVARLVGRNLYDHSAL